MEICVVDMRRLKLSQQYGQMLSLLPKEAGRKADSFRREEDRVRSAVGALLIRRGVEETLRRRELLAPYHIAYGKYGKPYVAEYPDICFSLSHSGALITFVKADSPVGIDVEEMDGHVVWADFDRFLTPQEMARIASSKNPIPEFYRIWTIREAFAKMTGQGLSIFEEDVRIDHEKGQIDYRGNRYMAKSFECENHILNVCMEKVPEDTHVHLMTKDEWNEKVLFPVK